MLSNLLVDQLRKDKSVMDYQKIYNQLIQKRLTDSLSKKDCYCESHHIIPRSEGGSDDDDNKVNLTAREHYIAHLLLAKIYNDYKMWYAWNMMLCKNSSQKRNFKYNNRIYGKLREEFGKKNSEFQKIRFSDPKNKEYLNKPKSELHKQHLRESFKNRDFNGEKNPMFGKNIKDFMTDEDYKKWRHNVGNSRRGKIGVFKCSESAKKKISAANKGRKHTDQSRSNMSKSQRKSYYKKLIKNFGFEQAKIEVCKLNSHKGWIRSIHKGYENLRVSKLALCDYLIDGWKLGHYSRDAIEKMRKTKINKVVSDETREKISKSKLGKPNIKLRGRHLSDEHKRRIAITRKNRKCGIGNKNAVGSKGHKGLKWITNGIIEKTIPIGENPPEWFRFGRCYNNRRKRKCLT